MHPWSKSGDFPAESKLLLLLLAFICCADDGIEGMKSAAPALACDVAAALPLAVNDEDDADQDAAPAVDDIDVEA